MSSKKNLYGHVAMLVSTLLYGLNLPILKKIVPEWISGVDATFFRIVGATILFWVVSAFIKNSKIDKKDIKTLLFSGMFGLFSFIYLLNFAIEYGSPVDIAIIMTLRPVLIIVISSIRYKTPITKRKWLGLLLSSGGALLLILMGHNTNDAQSIRSLEGNLLAIASAVCYSFYLLLIKKPSEKYRPVTMLRWIFLSSCITTIPFCVWGVSKAPLVSNPQLEPILFMLFIMFFTTFLTYLLLPMAIKRIGHETVSLYMYISPVATTIAAIFLNVDKIYWDQPIAVVIILLGVYITSTQSKKISSKSSLKNQ